MKVELLKVSMMNFILGVSKEIKWKVKVVLLSSIVDELHSSDIQGDQMEDESGVTRSTIDEFHSSDTEGDQMERQSDVTRSIIDKVHSWDIQRD